MQSWAIELLMFSDNIREGVKMTTEMRLALIASGHYDPASLLPGEARVVAAQNERRGWVTSSAARPADAMPVGEADAVEDYSDVQWESPSSSGEEGVMKDLELFNQAMSNTEITVGGEDEGGEWL